jgi:hypothetical protein
MKFSWFVCLKIQKPKALDEQRIYLRNPQQLVKAFTQVGKENVINYWLKRVLQSSLLQVSDFPLRTTSASMN